MSNEAGLFDKIKVLNATLINVEVKPHLPYQYRY